ncbi:hypothetical protein M5K25_008178 [Dendrobium thyrsiflorum]|uniref:Fibronectin type-III domain-containing protein n=1 Tax=Dendrobium thyrsiflorum TaxID=117978 RepID=A0ABD0V821_DENTH
MLPRTAVTARRPEHPLRSRMRPLTTFLPVGSEVTTAYHWIGIRSNDDNGRVKTSDFGGSSLIAKVTIFRGSYQRNRHTYNVSTIVACRKGVAFVAHLLYSVHEYTLRFIAIILPPISVDSHTSSCAISAPEENGKSDEIITENNLNDFVKCYPKNKLVHTNLEKEKKQQCSSKCKIGVELSKSTPRCKTLDSKKQLNHSNSTSSQAYKKQPRKCDNPVRLLITESSDHATMLSCKNSSCKAILSSEDKFCRKCSCCVCHLFDDKKDPSLWLVCRSESGDGDWCGLSCHIECALQHKKAGVVDLGQFMQLDGSYCCASCGKVSDIIGVPYAYKVFIEFDYSNLRWIYRILLSLSNWDVVLTSNWQTLINTGSSGATIQFGSVDFPAVVARTAATFTYGTDSEKTARRPNSAETSARSAHLSAPRVTVTQDPRRRISVFKRISQPEAPATKRIVTGGRISVKKEPETLSARVYRVLKTVKERSLQKRRYQRPLRVETRRTPPREILSFARVDRNERRQQTPHGEHRGVTLEPRVQGSAVERSRRKEKEIWRPKPHRDERGRITDLGVTSGIASRRSAPIRQQRQEWVQRKIHDDTHYDSRHPGESSRGSRRSPTSPKEKVSFDRSPRVEEILLPNQEPEIQWRRRSEIRMLEEEEEDIQDEDEQEMDDAINMEVIYMLRHTNINDEAYYDEGEDDEDRQPPVRRVYRRQREAGSTADRGDRSQGEQEADEVEENLFDDENATLANIRRQMRRQMRAKDREISQLNEKMTEMMAQMGAMMQMMQRTVATGPIPDLPTDPPNFQMPQVSGVRGAHEEGHEVRNTTRLPTPQNIASTSEPQLEEEYAVQLLMGNIDDKIQPFLCMATITTFQDLLDRVAKFEKLNLSRSDGHFDKPKKTKVSGAKRGEADSVFFSRASMAKQMIYNIDKGKQPMQYEEKLKQASSSKQRPSQVSSLKPRKVKSSKKKTKLKKPKEKKTITQKVIDSLDKYYQTVRQPIKLAYFMSGLKVEETEENGDADSLPTEVCRVISVVPSTPVNEECVKEAAVEYCMMVLPMDCSSEEDLYFLEEDESDPDLASQMEHLKPSSSLEAKASSSKAAKLPKQEREKKQVGRKKASPTLPKAAIIPKERKHIPHLGSDTEEDDVTPAKSRGVRQPSAKRRKEVEYANSDYDYESMNTVQCVFSRRIDSLSVSNSVLVVTRVPMQYFKEIIPREVHKVEELTTRYLPPLEKGTEPGSILYSVGIHEEENRDWCYKFVDSEELFPTRNVAETNQHSYLQTTASFWKQQLAVAKDAHQVDILCYRISLSYRLLNGTSKFKELHKIVEDAMRMLETEVGPVNGMSARIFRGNVSRLSVVNDLQSQCSFAIMKAEEFLNSVNGSIAKHRDSPSTACTFHFEEISSSSLVIVLNVSCSSAPDVVTGYKLCYCKSREEMIEKDHVLIPRSQQRILVPNLQPFTEYVFRIISVSDDGDLGHTESKCFTRGVEIIDKDTKQTGTGGCSSNDMRESKNPIVGSSGFKVRNLGKIFGPAWAQEEGCSDDLSQEDDVEEESYIGGVAKPLNTDEDRRKASVPHQLDLNVASVPDLNDDLSLPMEFSPEENGCILEKSGLERSNGSGDCHTCAVRVVEVPAVESQPDCRKHLTNRLTDGCDGDSTLVSAPPHEFSFRSNHLDDNYEYCVNVIRWLECLGHIEKDFRMKFLTWFSFSSTEQERWVVITFIRTLIEEPSCLAGQLLDAFLEIVNCKRPRNGFCRFPEENGGFQEFWHC